MKIYGCLRATGRTFLLNDHGSYRIGAVDPDSVRLAGSYVSYVEERDLDFNGDGEQNRLVVRSLRTGNVVHKAPLTEEDDGIDSLSDSVLKRDGSLGWISTTYEDDFVETQTYEVRTMDRETPPAPADKNSLDSPTTFDRGTSIKVASLRLSPDHGHVTWIDGAAKRHARIR